MTKGYPNVPLIQMYFSCHSVGATFIKRSSFHFSSSFPSGKLRKAPFCFSLSLWIASLHPSVSPEEIGRLHNFIGSFLLQLQARCPATFPVPVSGWAVQGQAMWKLGMCLPVNPKSFLAATISGKIRDYCIHRENLQKPAFSREFTFLTSKKKLAVSPLLQ